MLCPGAIRGMPLLPKEAKLDVAVDGIVEWNIRVEVFPKDRDAQSSAATKEGPGSLP